MAHCCQEIALGLAVGLCFGCQSFSDCAVSLCLFLRLETEEQVAPDKQIVEQGVEHDRQKQTTQQSYQGYPEVNVVRSLQQVSGVIN